jgi:hypothetical protein
MKTAPWFEDALPVMRGMAALFAVISIVGFSWFGGSAGGNYPPSYIASHYIELLGFLTVAFLPRKWLKYSPVRWVAPLLLATAILVTLPRIQGDLKLIDGADYPAAVLRCIACLLLVVGIVEIWLRSKTPELPNQRLERP